MDTMLEHIGQMQFLNQFFIALFLLVSMVLVARAVVAGTRYSPILIIVVFGLLMGFSIASSGVTEAGLPHFPMLALLSRTTIIALVVTFFVGGQELRKLIQGVTLPKDESVVYASEEVIFGTGRTQLVFILRSFFLLLGVDSLVKILLGITPDGELSRYYPLMAYFGLVISLIFIDSRAKIVNKRRYLQQGVWETLGMIAILVASFLIAAWIRPLVALPQIFFTMVLASGLGMLFYKWAHGPTVRCLLFAGIPIILAANFLIGGSLIRDALTIGGIHAVFMYGFFGQVFWMFGGIALLALVGRTRHVRNLAPGMAGALSHAGLTGACTAGDFGEEAARRAPIMINVPFIGHLFLFSILAWSVARGELLLVPALAVAFAGLAFTILSLRNMRRAAGRGAQEITALMLFSLGWQFTALFGGFLLLKVLPLPYAAMSSSSALSHFGLFAAIQGGMFGEEAAGLISFVFAMPFLVHPFVFFIFGRAMERNGEMPLLPVFVLSGIGLLGVIAATALALLS